MISMRRMTASCFSVLVAKSASAVSITYAAINRAALRTSRSRPNWSDSINRDCGFQNSLASKTVRGFLQRAAQDEINGPANDFLSLTRHFEQFGGRDMHGLVESH